MAEQILKSPGVSAREIDLTQPGQVVPQGVPAGVIGTAAKGPAFVPITFATYADFKSIFGTSEGTRFGPLAVITPLALSCLTFISVPEPKKLPNELRILNCAKISIF